MSGARDDQSVDLSDLVHVFDHELRTPLTALSGHLELVREHLAQLPPEVVWSLEVMSRAVERMETTVEGVALLEQASVELRSVG